MMRIVTVTLNPAIDMTVRLAEPLARGSVNLAESVTETPGGKGINVASFLADWGLGSSVTGLIGADNVGIFEGLFREKGLDDRFVRVPGKTRTNVKIVDGDETTDVNLPGLRADAPALRSLETILLDLAKEGPCILSLSGSLPKGCGMDIYANLTQTLRDIGAQVMLDTSGEALKTALDAPVKPLCAKPNRSELAAWTGRTIETEEDLIRAAKALLAGGMELLAVSMGGDGAAFFSKEGALHAKKRLNRLSSTVGAGDSMVAGIIAALSEGGDLERAARLGTAFAAARVDADFEGSLQDHGAIEAIASSVELKSIGL